MSTFSSSSESDDMVHQFDMRIHVPNEIVRVFGEKDPEKASGICCGECTECTSKKERSMSVRRNRYKRGSRNTFCYKEQQSQSPRRDRPRDATGAWKVDHTYKTANSVKSLNL